MTKFALIFFLIFISLSSNGAEVLCRHFFHTEDSVDRAIKAFQDGEKDTTSLRREMKFVIKTDLLNQYLQNLEHYFGERFQNRDKAAEGTANVTATDYMTVAKFVQNGKKLSAKVRLRKYFTRKLNDMAWKNLVPAIGFEDRSWLEVKIQHPELDNVVIKIRVLILDKDIKFVTTEEWFDYKKQILSRLKQINPKKITDIDKIEKFFDALYTTPAARVEDLFAKTAYDRISHSIKFKSVTASTKKIDVQLTLDQNIHLTRLKDNKSFNAYGKDETVIEVKIPVEYATLNAGNIAEMPDLEKIKKLIEWLDQHHEVKYPKNKGKMSKIDKKVEKDDLSDYD